jgi:3-deoxy-D-manno-octulosonic-acid transferase
MLRSSGIPFHRRADLSAPAVPAAPITLIESTGQLRELWAIADFAFVGGSLAPRGGQNLAEPAGCGLPLCFGPHVENFQRMAEQFLTAGAAVRVNSRDELLACLGAWLNDPADAARLGAAARQLVAGQTAALEQTVRGILAILPSPVHARFGVLSATSSFVAEEEP